MSAEKGCFDNCRFFINCRTHHTCYQDLLKRNSLDSKKSCCAHETPEDWLAWHERSKSLEDMQHLGEWTEVMLAGQRRIIKRGVYDANGHPIFADVDTQNFLDKEKGRI